ncbi:M20 aminoacylase family protein [Lutibaculum baratangense]|uniref:Hippurate hydrolase n=1 Tax=Lutibaculum baratangense AMV1 TaxID=631454 RepID=V4TFD0_9HYPH|nr:M20 aminoacylase family protein [Lutibaculum baratangense]ESR24868.1 Hippurate hydrolase [Lutibaculum baratangense AMV1]
MTVIPRISAFTEELVGIRHDLHAHPEIGFEETRTAAIVAERLAGWGIEVHTGIGGTGVVGILRGARDGDRRIGLRADMDALPMDELTNLPFSSKNPGRFHGCGHDGHTTMLLGAARYLAEMRDFAGTAVFIFQPAEEGLGGARAMIAAGLFERFPCDEVYGLHNAPDLEPGHVSVFPGKAMAGASFFDVTIRGRGSHAARPQDAKDPVVVATALAQSLQSVVSRNVDPLKAAVLSITRISAGSAYNVIPEEAELAGTIRYFDDAVGELAAARLKRLCEGFATSFDVEIEVDVRNVFSVLENRPAQTEELRQAVADVVGEAGADTTPRPFMGSEDFADMLQVVPGAYCWVGHAGNVPLHNPGFILDDGILPVGASILARIVERRLEA